MSQQVSSSGTPAIRHCCPNKGYYLPDNRALKDLTLVLPRQRELVLPMVVLPLVFLLAWQFLCGRGHGHDHDHDQSAGVALLTEAAQRAPLPQGEQPGRGPGIVSAVQRLSVQLIVNGVVAVSVWENNREDFEDNANQVVVLPLHRGDQVYVQLVSGRKLCSHLQNNIFTGYMLYPDTDEEEH
ncbi:hypothetical protein EYF80_056410 [Liparis tanakae]|uniref:C1q domain-containing protein n=1 Tax=Liparis tanakae TaxID=230148 RepID=A0A4Z2EYJ7_9TELE|nr:hypothetical protein EYF80_056410 [Liparis tanakae]